MLISRSVCTSLLAYVLLGTATMFAQSFPAFEQLPESKLPPDPLRYASGELVKTPEEWFQKRRPELIKLVQHYMYGSPPVASEKVTAEVVRVDKQALGGKAILREVTLLFGPENKGRINLLLITPAQAKGKIPVFTGLNFNGNHAVLPDPLITLPTAWMRNEKAAVQNNRATDAGRGTEVDGWSAQLLVERGYGLATAYYGDIDPDKPDWTDGVQALYYKAGQTEPAAHEWGSVAAWAWGLSRIADYLTTCEDLDAKRIGVIGHSRLGKTALLAGALDERFAIVCPHQSGTGGAALSRDNNQETVERINKVFPHWFNKNFHAFGGNEAKIPFDQHTVMALCAPRPILDTEGDQDKWANYDNSLRSIQAADGVYKFLGKRGFKAGKPVVQDEPFTAENFGELVQYRRDSKHVLSSDYWKRILDFADRYYAEAK
jgi:hypothetical protein